MCNKQKQIQHNAPINFKFRSGQELLKKKESNISCAFPFWDFWFT